MRAAILLLAVGISLPSVPLSTWTIVAADPKTGDVGVAGASCVDVYVDAIAALVPGKGVAVAQALWDRDNRNKVFELLRAGEAADAILGKVTDRMFDPGVVDRRYGIVTLNSGKAMVRGFTGSDAFTWAGSRQDPDRAVTVQGNILAGPGVVDDALKAFQSETNLPEALMRALEAGSVAGGDSRCNNTRGKQTASAAFILLARGGGKPYAARDIGISDQGKPDSPWLALSVREPQFGRNPVAELRKKFDEWKKARDANAPRASGRNY